MNVLIGGAWPYANGPLHIGHIAALLPGDVLARWYRASGHQVCFVSGSDCHGTPVSIRATSDGCTPQEVSDHWHEDFVRCFARYRFSYDDYGKTSSAVHGAFVTRFHQTMYDGCHVEEREVRQAWCVSCNRFLPDRYVSGDCPECGKQARGDQCEACGAVLEPEHLNNPKCALCGTQPEIRGSHQLFLLLSHFQKTLEQWLETHHDWRKNAQENTARYLREGLRDRAITRDLDWGIPVPYVGYEGKCIYIWAENVLGYLSGCSSWCEEGGIDFQTFWNNARLVFVHGKDNIPFHTVILPGLLLANAGSEEQTESGNHWRLPDQIISSEYLTLDGRKISTSGNWSVSAWELAQEAPVDSVRYFLLANGPEKRDADFSRRTFALRHNSELIGVYGNFINRSVAFVERHLDGKIPEGKPSEKVLDHVGETYDKVGELLLGGELKAALESVLNLFRFGNRLFDAEKPWETKVTAPGTCHKTLVDCLYLVLNGCRLAHPFLPNSAETVLNWFEDVSGWVPAAVKPGLHLSGTRKLFERLEVPVVPTEEKVCK